MLIEKLKMLRQTPACGVALFAERYQGITELIPPKPIKELIYRCGNKYYTESLVELYQEEILYGLVLISANKTYFYHVSRQDYTLLKTQKGFLGKRQKKGGQSANRIARLTEETRAAFVKSVSENINALFDDVKGLIVSGPGELKRNVVRSGLVNAHIPIVTMDTMDEPTDATMESYFVVCKQFIANYELEQARNEIRNLQNLFVHSMDRIVIGIDEVMNYIDIVEKIIVHEDHVEQIEAINKNKFVLPRQLNESEIFLHDYGGIVAYLYYPIDINCRT